MGDDVIYVPEKGKASGASILLLFLLLISLGVNVYLWYQTQEYYNSGYIQGIEDGVGIGYNIHDPTYSEVILFIEQDKTDEYEYDRDGFNCQDFSATVKRNAFNKGYRCFYVSIEFPEGAHAIIGFNTTDQGFIYIEPQHDKIVTLQIGNKYSELNEFEAPGYDDTIISIDLIP